MQFDKNTTEEKFKFNYDCVNIISGITRHVLGRVPLKTQTLELSEQIRAVFNVDACIIRIIEGEGLDLLANSGVPESKLIPSISVNEGISRKIISQRVAFKINDARENPLTADLYRHYPDSFRFVSYAGAPMVLDDTVVGIIGIYSEREVIDFSDTVLEHLQLIANQLAVSIVNDRLYKDLAEQKQSLLKEITERKKADFHSQILSELGHELSYLTNSNDAAKAIADAADKLIGWDASSLMLYSKEKELIYGVLNVDTINGEKNYTYAVNRGYPPSKNARKIITEGAQLILRKENVVDENFLTFGDVTHRSASLMYVPVNIRGEIGGLFTIQSYKPNAYTKKDLETLQELADHCSSALERIQAEMALREREELYRKTITQADAVPYQKDYVSQKFTFLGEGILKLTGYSSSELDPGLLSNMVRETIMRGETEGLSEQEAYEQAQKGKIKELHADYQIVTREGELKWIADNSIQTVDPQNNVTGSMGILMDITDRKERERELGAIASFSKALRAAQTRTQMLHIILDQFVQLLKLEGCAIALKNSVSDEIVIEIAQGDFEKAAGKHFPKGEGTCGQVMNTGQSCMMDGTHPSTCTCGCLLMENRAFTCIPLSINEQIIGSICMSRNYHFDPDTKLLTALIDMVANAIHRTTLNEKTERQLQHITALHTIDTAITASFDMKFTLSVILSLVTNHLEVDAADVLLYNSKSQMLEFAEGTGFYYKSMQDITIQLGEGITGEAVLNQKVLHVPDIRKIKLVRSQLQTEENFIFYYAVPLVSKGQIRGLLEVFHRKPLNPDPEWIHFMDTFAGQVAIAIDNEILFNELQQSNLELMMAYDTTLEGWSRALDLRDNNTEGHTRRVTDMTLKLAQYMGMSDSELIHVRRGALLHDIGKMGIPDSILHKPGSLTPEEWAIMKKHPIYAYELISKIPFLKPAIDIPYYHHEKWDGTGYPRGLKGKQIPFTARIFAVVDVWDALNSDRPYQKAWPRDKIIEHICLNSGRHFDPQVVDTFLKIQW